MTVLRSLPRKGSAAVRSESSTLGGWALRSLPTLLALVGCATQVDGATSGSSRDGEKPTAIEEAGQGGSAPEQAGTSSGATADPGSSGGNTTSAGGSEPTPMDGGEGGGETETTGGSVATSGSGGMEAGGTSGGMPAGGTATAGTTMGGGTSTSGGAGAGGMATGGTGGAGSAGESTAGSAGVSDSCPDNPDKVDPGVCGCSEPDEDSDGDGTFDCEDDCPDDENKTDPGDCGCSYEDTPECAAMIAGIVHRYSFDGSGATATDSVGGSNGDVLNTTLSGAGSLTLSGVDSSECVDLPNGIISGLTDATLEVWVTWDGGNPWQRIFDFGSNSGGEGAQGNGQTYLFLTPMALNSSGLLRVAFSTNGNGSAETFVDGTAALGSGVSQVAVVVNDSNDTLELYRDGALEGSEVLTESLSGLSDVNNWLGRSQFTADDDFGGTIDEFRIYDVALDAATIEASYAAGPDAGFLD